MKEQLKVSVDGKTYGAEINRKKHDRVTVDGTEYIIEVLKRHGGGVTTFSINNRIMTVQLKGREGSAGSIRHGNFLYATEVKSEVGALLEQFMKTKKGAADESVVKAPMPGLVVKVTCQPGQQVKKGDKLVIIEAMKMENALACPADGTVKAILCKEGAPVEKDTVLVELEPEAGA